jgi:TRAP-type C4-dicarboxylate transport system permease small subunit
MAAAARRDGAVDRVSTWLALAGGGLVLALALLVTASVLRRWLTSQPIQGDFELVQIGLAVAVFAFLPICQLRGANIIVDSFTARAPATLRAALDASWALVYALVAALIAWQMVAGTREAFASRTTSMVLALPIGWGMALATAFAFWLAAVALVTAARAVRRSRA